MQASGVHSQLGTHQQPFRWSEVSLCRRSEGIILLHGSRSFSNPAGWHAVEHHFCAAINP